MSIRHNIWATRAFFAERFVACFLVSVLYIILAAAVQSIIVGWMGESTFNYMLAGVCSLLIAVPVSGYLGSLLLVITRCRHVCALAYMKRIDKDKLSAYDVGCLVFKKHMTSFGLVYGVSFLIERASNKLEDDIWDMLDGVPLAAQLKRFCNFYIVKRIGRGVFRTAFDAVVYYLVRFTAAGIGDDAAASGKALKQYLYTLPSLIKTSVPAFLVVYALPSILQGFVASMLIATHGFVGGIFMTVLSWPLFFVLRKVICEPAMTVALLTCFGLHCKDELDEDSKVKAIVDAILEEIGLSDMGESTSEDNASEQTSTNAAHSDPQPEVDSKQTPTKPEPPEPEPEPQVEFDRDVMAKEVEDDDEIDLDSGMAALRNGGFAQYMSMSDQERREYQSSVNNARLRVVSEEEEDAEDPILSEDESPEMPFGPTPNVPFVAPEGPRNTSSILSHYFQMDSDNDEVEDIVHSPTVDDKEWG